MQKKTQIKSISCSVRDSQSCHSVASKSMAQLKVLCWETNDKTVDNQQDRPKQMHKISFAKQKPVYTWYYQEIRRAPTLSNYCWHKKKEKNNQEEELISHSGRASERLPACLLFVRSFVCGEQQITCDVVIMAPPSIASMHNLIFFNVLFAHFSGLVVARQFT